MNKKRVLKLVNVSLLVAILFFVARFIVSNLKQLSSFDFDFNVVYLFLSIVCIWLWLFISSIGLHLITQKVNNTVSFVVNLKIWATSYLGLYVPGKVGVIAHRIIKYQKQGLSAAQVSYCFFLEMILSVISSGLVILISSLFLQFNFIAKFYPIIIGFIILLLVMIHPLLIQRYATFYFRFIKKKQFEFVPPHDYYFYLKLILLQFSKWLFVGFGIFLLINSFTVLPLVYYPYITGLYAGAAILGMLAFFSPSGLGVIEGIMILGLKEIVENALAGVISILIRLWKLVGELSFVLLVHLLLWITDNQNEITQKSKKHEE